MKIKEYFNEFNFSENFKFSFRSIKGDLIGGLTSAIVALPLALGFGLLAYNGDPQGAIAGLYGAIFTGILASMFGGTPQQITGPTGGMTVILTTVYMNYGGASALLAACIIAGLLQIVFGLFKLGKFVSLVPYPVTVGFTNGIAILIFIQQLGTFNTAPVVALVTMATIAVVPAINKSLPKSLIGLLAGTFIVYLFSTNPFLRIHYDIPLGTFDFASAIKTIGKIPSSFQIPALPAINWQTWKNVFPAGLTIAMLGAIETLLASVVADNATNGKHNSNKELVGQGIGNFAAPFFGGIAGTGAIVRTMVNIRAGGKTRLSGIIHGVIIVIVILFLGKFASRIPLAALSGVLMMTAIGMMELEPIKLLPKTPLADGIVMIVTILITVFIDLITAVEAGMVMAAFLFVYRMSQMGMDKTLLEEVKGVALDDATLKQLQDHKIVVVDIEGPLFFGAAKQFVRTLELDFDVSIVILNMENVPIIDTSGAVAIENIVDRLYVDKKRLLIVGMRSNVRSVLHDLGISQKIGIGNFLPKLSDAIPYALAITREKAEQTHLSNYVSPNLIVLDVEAQDRDSLLDYMVTKAVEAGAVGDKETFLQSLIERERTSPTYIGKGVAVPHARQGGADEKVVVVFARLKTPIQYDPLVVEKVSMVFMVSTGSNDKQYLSVLRMIASNIGNAKIYERIINARDSAEVHNIFSEVPVKNS